MSRGKLFILSGPSGSGKGSVLKELRRLRDRFHVSVSATTRDPREGEVHGREYYFVSRESFLDMIEKDQLLEYADYLDCFYGTPLAPVEEKLAAGWDVILEIDTVGAEKICAKRPETPRIFLFPVSFQVLEQRLRARDTETEEKIQKRLSKGREECRKADAYDYIIINDILETAAQELHAIMTAEKCRTADRIGYVKEEI